MEEGILPVSKNLGNPSDALMDIDFMDELLLDGCWLESNNGTDFSQFYSAPISPFEPSFAWPALESDKALEFNNEDDQAEEIQQSSFPENELIESRKRCWIGPRPKASVMDRLIQALGHIRDRSRDKDVLIQVWVPVRQGGKCVLTTHNQPFSLDLNCSSLAHYREISVKYQFVADEDSKEVVGLPGRVFMNRVPEWTPDVRFFTWDEYPRVDHAQLLDVRGTLAVPILEQGSRSCLGVIEVILTTQKIHYRPELDSVCQALEAVNLKSADVSSTNDVKTSDSSYQAALPEILDVLRSACVTHGLPLAQTWVPCALQGKGGCWHSNDNSRNCLSSVELACHVADPRIRGFREACSECHLLKDQGIVGKALGTNQPCFSPDVSACSKTEYPLSHHARMFGLKAAVAIRLRSISTGSSDFVLEFFLPTSCVDPEDQKIMLTSLSATIQEVCQTLRVVTDIELREEENFPVVNTICEEIPKVDHLEFPRKCSDQVSLRDGKSGETIGDYSETGLDGQPDSTSKERFTLVENSCTSGNRSSLHAKRTGEKKRGKTEKTITLEVLRQHFAGSLKDAARNLGVCPTTLKRICRHHGIQRWPSRKIKKVGHSLQKIQRVIDSVQGTSGVLQIDSFYSNFPELASPNASRTTHFSNSKSSDNLVPPFDAQPGSYSTILRGPPDISASPSSSCSPSSNSSQCCSNEAQPNPNSVSPSEGHEDPTVKEDPDSNGTAKLTKSDVNLHPLSDGGLRVIPRSQSLLSCWPDMPETLQPSVEDRSISRDGPRIKVTYGEDTIRFRMQRDWRYRDLLQEISRRFGVEDARGGFHLKYLDDDAEWVLLTCDDDLVECMDVWRSLGAQTIKLAFIRDSQSQFGRPLGLSGPSSL